MFILGTSALSLNALRTVWAHLLEGKAFSVTHVVMQMMSKQLEWLPVN